MPQPATADSPRVVISYHVSDEAWANKLMSQLASRSGGKYRIWTDRVENKTLPPLGNLPRIALLTAKVLVILISPEYLACTWVGTAEGHNFLMARNKQELLGVLVKNAPREQLSLLPPHYIGMNATPLAEATADDEEIILSKTVNLVSVFIEDDSTVGVEGFRPATRIAEVSRYAWSDEAESALSRARQLASTGGIVTTTALLFGLAEGGRSEAPYFRTPQFLWDALTSGGDFQYTKMLTEEFTSQESLRENERVPATADLISPNGRKVIELAATFARRTRKSDSSAGGPARIGARHLLAALLVFKPANGPTIVSRRLVTIVGDVSALRKRFYNFIVTSLPDDDDQAWRSILVDLNAPELQQSPPKRPQDFTQPTVAGFLADDWQGRDLLGIERDVNALASLVAAYKVEPPLSVGLFGDWGSGKSHFMRQMRKRVELLSQKARESGKPQNELGYYKNIVQIDFNAWHYIEGNLWASLVDHIFANLKLWETEPRKYADQRRDELMQKLGLKGEIQDKINSKVQGCEDELRKLNERKEKAETERDQAANQLNGFREQAKANLKTLSIAVSFTEHEKELLNRLGMNTDSTITAADVHSNYLKLKDRGNSVRAKWKLFRTDKRVGRRYVLGALLVAIVIGAPALLKSGVLPGLPTIVVSILGVVATLLAAAKPAWEQFQKSLEALEKHDQEVERERQKRITELENEVSALTKEVVAAKLESETVGKEIAKLKADIDNTSSSRILAEFIEDRAAASDYRRHLGLLALIRRDFEKLRDLFEQQRKEENEGTEVEDKKKINRIVLYIDDLDRCPPDRVVQVLQAIHLLLAFPLFVVVVGVDSRWITRSLQQSYDWLRESDEETLAGEKKHRENDGNNDAGLATPHDYLEKIFQIPFWLRSMNDGACVEFLDGLTKEAIDQGIEAVEQQAGRPGPSSETKDSFVVNALEIEAATHVAPDALETVRSALSPEGEVIEPGLQTSVTEKNIPEQTTPAAVQEEIDLAPRSLTFNAREIEYMKKLVPLIGRSPRAVKRFLNCYRLIKVGLAPAEFDSFVGDDGESNGFKAAMILLGVITGAPGASSFVLDELKIWNGAKEFKFDAFKAALVSKPQVLKQQDAERLVRFFNTHDFGKPSNALFEKIVHFGPQVSRFSFRVDRANTAGDRPAVSRDRAMNARPPRKRATPN